MGMRMVRVAIVSVVAVVDGYRAMLGLIVLSLPISLPLLHHAMLLMLLSAPSFVMIDMAMMVCTAVTVHLMMLHRMRQITFCGRVLLVLRRRRKMMRMLCVLMIGRGCRALALLLLLVLVR